MRLIDADALKVALDKCGKEPDYQHEGEDWRNGICIAETIIDNAPTVEPEKAKEGELVKAYTKGFDAGVETVRPQGEWIKEDDEHLKGWYRCSECGRRVEDLTDDVVIHAGCEDYTIADIYPYCHCGADMRGTENGD